MWMRCNNDDKEFGKVSYQPSKLWDEVESEQKR